VRKFRFDILGDFPIIMADPPWDIHMELPYGTLSGAQCLHIPSPVPHSGCSADEEMLKLNVQCLQSNGVMFLWVTGML
jgi:mRNA (2'-O-methyladenosine-N6-)-methyltransferase